jgi:hypothetical protein
MKKQAIVVVLVMILAVWGCAGMTDTQQRTVSGAAIGAAAGTAIGAISGSAGWGAAIGAAAGGAGGFIYGRHEESKEAAYRQGVEDGKKQQ